MGDWNPRRRMERLLVLWAERTPPAARWLLGLWVIVGLTVSLVPAVRRWPEAIRIILNAPLLAFLLVFFVYMFARRLYWLSWPVRKAWHFWMKRKAG